MLALIGLQRFSCLGIAVGDTGSEDGTYYDFTANWSWSADGGASASVENHVTGNIGGHSTQSWCSESGYGCGDGCGCNFSNGGACNSGFIYEYDETVA